MSGVIWGIINTDNNKASLEQGIKMQEILEEYKIDNFQYINNENIFLGCGIQYITEESLIEKLPYYDEDSSIYITADAIIDNREELLKELSLNNAINDFTDSQYILMAYKKWGIDCTKYLLGDYSFVIFDKSKHIILCAKDHLGTRPLYYYFKNNKFIFSTSINAILKILDTNEIKLNERWIADFLSLMYAETSENEETIYDGIMQVQSAHTITINNNKLTKHLYWNPEEKIKEIKLTEDEYKQKFMNIYNEAVKCRIRSIKETGLFLSGGLDSSSVAALTSPILKEKNKVLKTFTSVPKSNFEKISKKTKRVNDESYYVSLLKNYIGNMDNKFYSFDKNNAYNVIDEYTNIIEQPYKIIENTQWYNNLIKEASKENCKILLTGSYGNTTVSAGEFEICKNTLLDKFKFISLLKEINYYSKESKVSRRKLIKSSIYSMVPLKIRKKRFYKKCPEFNKFHYSQINTDLMKKYDIKKRFDENEINEPIHEKIDLSVMKSLIVNSVLDTEAFNEVTKMSLKSGIIIRDPTADVRMIEFCLSLPLEQIYKDGIGRRLIRKNFKNLIPNEILMNMNCRGLQGADWIERIKPIWNEIYEELSTLLKDDNISKYLNVEKIKAELDKTKEGINDEKRLDIRFLLESLIFSKFIYKFYLEKGCVHNEKSLDKTRNEEFIS